MCVWINFLQLIKVPLEKNYISEINLSQTCINIFNSFCDASIMHILQFTEVHSSITSILQLDLASLLLIGDIPSRSKLRVEIFALFNIHHKLGKTWFTMWPFGGSEETHLEFKVALDLSNDILVAPHQSV